MESDSNSISLHGFCFVAFGFTSVYYQLTVMTCCCYIISSSVVESLTTSQVQSCWVFGPTLFFFFRALAHHLIVSFLKDFSFWVWVGIAALWGLHILQVEWRWTIWVQRESTHQCSIKEAVHGSLFFPV